MCTCVVYVCEILCFYEGRFLCNFLEVMFRVCVFCLDIYVFVCVCVFVVRDGNFECMLCLYEV